MATKTDKQVQQDVMAELEWEPSVNPAQIGVEVKNGIVTLAGHVMSYAEKWDAERAAQRVAGVKALAVEVDVTLPGLSERSDADIAGAVDNVLQWLTYLPKGSVKAMVEGGWVILSGEVSWEYQRQAAVAAVRNLMGITGITDHITIKPTVSLGTVKADIELALQRRAENDAQNITVEVWDDDITLSGVVHSLAERQLARDAAWNTPGVKNVIDNMTITY